MTKALFEEWCLKFGMGDEMNRNIEGELENTNLNDEQDFCAGTMAEQTVEDLHLDDVSLDLDMEYDKADQPEVCEPGLYLCCLDVRGSRKYLKIETEPQYIGREDTADMSIPDRRVSRKHAKVCLNPRGQVLIEDCGSTNGTSVNGHKLKRARIVRRDDSIQISGYKMHIEEIHETLELDDTRLGASSTSWLKMNEISEAV